MNKTTGRQKGEDKIWAEVKPGEKQKKVERGGSEDEITDKRCQEPWRLLISPVSGLDAHHRVVSDKLE